jgi:hypothetical protein
LRSYGVLVKGNYYEVTGNSEVQAIVRLYTFLACVCMTENTLPLPQALFLHDNYAAGLNCKTDYDDTIKWLSQILSYEIEEICFTQPLFIFDGRDYWQIVFDEIQSGQYVSIKAVQTVIIRDTWKRYLILSNGLVEEYALEYDRDSEIYELNLEAVDLGDTPPSQFLKEFVLDRIHQLIYKEHRTRKL